jgi:exopolyphosphatase/guanosine-5'-triphosphate,3'-diphosphate pyrophosphatase
MNRYFAGMQFPARLAAIDLGSNAIRFVVAEFKDSNEYRLIEQVRLPMRLGRSVFDRGELTPEVISGTLAALQTIADKMQDLAVEGYRAVATSAVRESRNRDELIERARAQTGIELEIITGDEEARLVYLAVRTRMSLGAVPWLLVDIGGGSMEIAAIDDERMLRVESHRVGALRFAGHANAESDDVGRMREEIESFVSQLEHSPVFGFQFAGMIAGGGSIDALVRLIGQPALKRTAMNNVITRLAPLSYAERARQFKLPADRADVILAAAILYERIAAHIGADEIIVPQVGVKEGVLLELAVG